MLADLDWRQPIQTSALQLTLMRGFELTCDGCHVSLPRSAQRLIAFLALNERPVLRSYAASTLWLDSPEPRSSGSLRTTLWRLRRPGHKLIEHHGECLTVCNGVAVDVRALAITARRLSRGESVLDRAGVQELAAGGELLPGWYEDWVVMERERTRHLRLQALEAACELLTACGRHGEALAMGLAAVETEPLRESAQRAVIRAHAAVGSRGEALRQYRRYVELLARELQIEPSVEMRQLAEALRRP